MWWPTDGTFECGVAKVLNAMMPVLDSAILWL
jgi:hypothetical protein